MGSCEKQNDYMRLFQAEPRLPLLLEGWLSLVMACIGAQDRCRPGLQQRYTPHPSSPCLVHGCPVRGHLDLDASSVGEVNHRIKLSAQWSDVAKVVTEMGERLHPSNVAYALYRLGCLFCFLSSQRKAGIAPDS